MSTPSAYQKVVTQYDVTEAGVDSIFYSVWDNTDDILPITLPAITGGTVALVGLNGIWIEDDWDYAGGTLDIGPTTIAGLPAGILDVVGDLCAVIINDRAWTAAERAGVVAWGKSRGAPGVFSLGPELVTNGDFSDGATGWSGDGAGGWSITGGAATSVSGVFNANITTVAAETFETGKLYKITYTLPSYTSGNLRFGVGSATYQAAPVLVGNNETYLFATGATANFNVNNGAATLNATVDNISVRKLELIP